MSRDDVRIALPDDSVFDDLPDEFGKLRDAGTLINVHRALLRSPDIAKHVIGLGAAYFTSGSLASVDRELVILACGHLFQAPYEAAQHEPISKAVGVTDDQRAAIGAGVWGSPCFTAAQRALLMFVAQAAATPQVEPQQFETVRAHFDDRQVVETVVLVGYYFLIARISTVLDVPIDAPTDDSLLRAIRAMLNPADH